MVKLAIEGDTLVFDKRGMDIKKFVDEAERQCQFTLTRIQAAADKGLDADGKALKGYSANYIKAIQKGYVKGGSDRSRRKYSTTTTLQITGDLLGSRQVKRLRNGAECVFTGSHATAPKQPEISNADLAQALHKKGFKGWHKFGNRDLKRADKAYGLIADEAIDKTLVVKKGF